MLQSAQELQEKEESQEKAIEELKDESGAAPPGAQELQEKERMYEQQLLVLTQYGEEVEEEPHCVDDLTQERPEQEEYYIDFREGVRVHERSWRKQEKCVLEKTSKVSIMASSQVHRMLMY